jgi:hypothetical protein
MYVSNHHSIQSYVNKRSFPILPKVTPEVLKIAGMSLQNKITASLQMPRDQQFFNDVLVPLHDSVFKGYVVMYDTLN